MDNVQVRKVHTIEDHRAKEKAKKRREERAAIFRAVLPFVLTRKLNVENACQLAMEASQRGLEYIEAIKEARGWVGVGL